MDVKKIDHAEHLYEVNRAVRARRVAEKTQMVDSRTGQVTEANPGDFVCSYDPPLFKGSKLVSWVETEAEFQEVYAPLHHEDPESEPSLEGFSLTSLERKSKKDLKQLAAEIGLDVDGYMKSEIIQALLDTNNP